METILTLMQNGVSAPDFALTINRVALGLFFAISGYHKLFNAGRHSSLVATFKDLGIPMVRFNQWFVPTIEFLGGLSLLSGVLAPLAATGLGTICAVACLTDGAKRVRSYQPIDKADVIDDVLYLPEVLYIIGLAIVVAAGPGYTIVSLFF